MNLMICYEPSKCIEGQHDLASCLEDDDSPVSLYLRVKHMIRQKIYAGSWAVNKKMLSESELINLLGCSHMTVNRVLRE